MCGITGIIKLSNSSPELVNIKEMTCELRHRGPDDEGFAFFAPKDNKLWTYGGEDTPESVYAFSSTYSPQGKYRGQCHRNATVAFGHRRLSILDLSPAGHQPMSTDDGNYWIVYNGEIYNYLEVREDLVRAGQTFSSNSDTEVLLKAYAVWGKECLSRLVGMFAFAIFDRRENIVFLARDFFGIKPLYYVSTPDCFAFASEIKSLVLLPQIRCKINPQRVFEYLRFGHADYGDKTLFKDISQLPAAHYLNLNLNQPRQIEKKQYWNIDLTEKSDISFNDAAKQIQDLFIKNIELHLRSDVPVGAALSGGLDSSAIVMSMRKIQGNNLDLHTFSYIAEDPAINEEKWVNIIAHQSNAHAHKITPDLERLTQELETLVYIQDEPFVSTSIYSQYCVMRLASEKGIKVMLDGQGADETLGGYTYFYAAQLASMIRNVSLFKLIKAVPFYLNLTKSQFAELLARTGSHFLPSSLQAFAYRLYGNELIPKWMEKSWIEDKSVKKEAFNYATSGKELLREELYVSLMQRGLISLLRYEDRNSMAFSIESRVPFLTPELTSFILSLPEDYIINLEGVTKNVFRQAMQGIIPNQILSRRDKIGFATPEISWLRLLRPWFEEILNSETARNISFLNLPEISREWQNVVEKRKKFNPAMWRLINLIAWVKRFDVSL